MVISQILRAQETLRFGWEKECWPIAVFKRGRYEFRLINYEIRPEVRTIALSVKDGRNPQELVALIDERHSNNGSIEHHKVGHPTVVDSVDAIRRTKRVLGKLRHPLLSSALSYVKDAVSLTSYIAPKKQLNKSI